MGTKIYDVTIGRKVWITRDVRGDSSISLWTKKPRKMNYSLGDGYFWRTDDNWLNYISNLCCDEFIQVTGLEIALGACIGPVYIGVVEI